jgi:hypothetical protein
VGWTTRFQFLVGAMQDFSLHYCVQTGSGAHPASYTMGMGGGAVTPGAKRPGREADHSPSGFRMRGATSPLLQYVFMAWCLVKHRHNFTFTLQSFLSCSYGESQA